MSFPKGKVITGNADSPMSIQPVPQIEPRSDEDDSALPGIPEHVETFDEYSARIRDMPLEKWMEWKANNPY